MRVNPSATSALTATPPLASAASTQNAIRTTSSAASEADSNSVQVLAALEQRVVASGFSQAPLQRWTATLLQANPAVWPELFAKLHRAALPVTELSGPQLNAVQHALTLGLEPGALCCFFRLAHDGLKDFIRDVVQQSADTNKSDSSAYTALYQGEIIADEFNSEHELLTLLSCLLVGAFDAATYRLWQTCLSQVMIRSAQTFDKFIHEHNLNEPQTTLCRHWIEATFQFLAQNPQTARKAACYHLAAAKSLCESLDKLPLQDRDSGGVRIALGQHPLYSSDKPSNASIRLRMHELGYRYVGGYFYTPREYAQRERIFTTLTAWTKGYRHNRYQSKRGEIYFSRPEHYLAYLIRFPLELVTAEELHERLSSAPELLAKLTAYEHWERTMDRCLLLPWLDDADAAEPAKTWTKVKLTQQGYHGLATTTERFQVAWDLVASSVAKPQSRLALQKQVRLNHFDIQQLAAGVLAVVAWLKSKPAKQAVEARLLTEWNITPADLHLNLDETYWWHPLCDALQADVVIEAASHALPVVHTFDDLPSLPTFRLQLDRLKQQANNQPPPRNARNAETPHKPELNTPEQIAKRVYQYFCAPSRRYDNLKPDKATALRIASWQRLKELPDETTRGRFIHKLARSLKVKDELIQNWFAIGEKGGEVALQALARDARFTKLKAHTKKQIWGASVQRGETYAMIESQDPARAQAVRQQIVVFLLQQGENANRTAYIQGIAKALALDTNTLRTWLND